MENNCLESGGVVWEEGGGNTLGVTHGEAGKPTPACWAWCLSSSAHGNIHPLPVLGSSQGNTQTHNTFESQSQLPRTLNCEELDSLRHGHGGSRAEHRHGRTCLEHRHHSPPQRDGIGEELDPSTPGQWAQPARTNADTCCQHPP